MDTFKPGDLVEVIKSRAGNEGKRCQLIRFLGKVPGLGGDRRWEVDITMLSNRGNPVSSVQEGWIKKIPPKHEVGSWDEVQDICKWKPETTNAVIL